MPTQTFPSTHFIMQEVYWQDYMEAGPAAANTDYIGLAVPNILKGHAELFILDGLSWQFKPNGAASVIYLIIAPTGLGNFKNMYLVHQETIADAALVTGLHTNLNIPFLPDDNRHLNFSVTGGGIGNILNIYAWGHIEAKKTLDQPTQPVSLEGYKWPLLRR